ncbi:arylsulfatase [Carboxylicivirga caseinilyticus]|uniref:arylsulfatase n=1 Tax=Carboxylicivirga caseinilyticus TaxID=3417572 RepID=UPI003D353899|nr:arylsulfatase [Marinilabiliaceae bacterium A049]
MRYPVTVIKILFLTVIAILSACAEKQKQQRPNVILIMADDMGYSDIGCYGGDVQTPNIDKLANEGVRFTQFYNGARCCPTRASLMTGCYPHQTGIGHMTNTPENFKQHDLDVDEYRGFLNHNCVTIAEVLKQSGYSTLMTGKWHLGISDSTKWPLQRGFDKFYGCIVGATNFFKPQYPRGIVYMNDTISINDENYYTTDAFTDNAIQFIDESEKESGKPFFLYLAYTAPHWPLNAPKEIVEKYKGHYKEGWSKLRSERYDRMKQLGIIDDNWLLSGDDGIDWDSLSEDKKNEMDLRRAIYSAMIDQMDYNIGKLTDYLKQNNLLDNTLIIFLSDNGGCEIGGMLGGGPASQLGTKEGYFLTYGKAWANLSNTPFKEYKHWVHEGGISTPLIVHWPQQTTANVKGKLVSQYGFLPDIMATILDATGATYPKDYNGKSIPPHSGKSFLPVVKGNEKEIHTEPIFWEHEGNKAVRLGNYKLVSKWKNNETAQWELYDMVNDRTEMHNLVESMPDKVIEMEKMYLKWASDKKVLPWNEVLQKYKSKN